jgi:hypothetical protein
MTLCPPTAAQSGQCMALRVEGRPRSATGLAGPDRFRLDFQCHQLGQPVRSQFRRLPLTGLQLAIGEQDVPEVSPTPTSVWLRRESGTARTR